MNKEKFLEWRKDYLATCEGNEHEEAARAETYAFYEWLESKGLLTLNSADTPLAQGIKCPICGKENYCIHCDN